MTTDPWATDLSYGGRRAVCGRSGCSNPAAWVGLVTPSHRVVSCEGHEDELRRLREMVRENPRPTAPPTETMRWRRDDRFRA